MYRDRGLFMDLTTLVPIVVSLQITSIMKRALKLTAFNGKTDVYCDKSPSYPLRVYEQNQNQKLAPSSVVIYIYRYNTARIISESIYIFPLYTLTVVADVETNDFIQQEPII